jgi:alkylated DNA repair dioxygenase AlkB
MKGPPAGNSPDRGDTIIRDDGYSYLPRFISQEEAQGLADYFAGLHPIWEKRHADGSSPRRGGDGRLTRPVYWLGAWQFASLGYYAEPDHLIDKCVRAEPLPEIMVTILERLRPELVRHGDEGAIPNTCLINFYGSERKGERSPPVDYARLQMHRDAEPGPVVMFSVGQPAQFEFVEPEGEEPEHSQWIRNRSVVVLSGANYKDRLYHRVTRVRYGQDPELTSKLEGFSVRRVSVSFRHVPENAITDLGQLGSDARSVVIPYVEELAKSSEHFRAQLDTLSR